MTSATRTTTLVLAMTKIPTAMCVTLDGLDYFGRASSLTVYDAVTLCPLGKSGSVSGGAFEFMGAYFEIAAKPATPGSKWRMLTAVEFS